MKIGQYNRLKVSRNSDFGLYLTDEQGAEVLLPSRYVTEQLNQGDDIEVFVYNDSEDRLVATTEHPYATVGEFAFLTVKATNSVGAFLDWGLMKDLLVPFSNQNVKMKKGNSYPVYIYLDDASKRIVATAKLKPYLGNVYPDLKPGKKVDALVIKSNEIGYLCVVNNLHRGMIYENETFRPLEPGSKVVAFVKQVRPDGKIDLTLSDKTLTRINTLAKKLTAYMERNGGVLDLGDHSSADIIKIRFQCSKKDFKKTIGLLLKERKIGKAGEGYALLTHKIRKM